jgi:ABC-type transport system involved in multi-copper enzyme maturation permease subunit
MKALLVCKHTYNEMFQKRMVLMLLFLAVVLLFFLNRFFTHGSLLIDFYFFAKPKTTTLELRLGLNIITTVAMFLGIYTAAYAFRNEKMKSDVALVLVRPVSRFSYLIGRLFGIWGVLVSFSFILSAVFVGIVFFSTGECFYSFIMRIVISQINVITIAGLVAFFSIVFSPFTGGMIGISVYLADVILNLRFPVLLGSLLGWTHNFDVHPVYLTVRRLLEYLLPPFSTILYLVKSEHVEPLQYILHFGRMAGWSAFYIILMSIWFYEKDIWQ